MLPTIERAVVVTIDECATLLMALDDERKILQQLSKQNPADPMHFYINRFGDIDRMHRKLEEIQRIMRDEEIIWEERMREYEDSSDTEQEDEDE